MIQMRHDNLANALRVVVFACSCQSVAEPRYRALAGKKGMVECQCRGDIVAVLPRRELAAVDVVVAHASAKSYAAEAAKTSGWTAARAERTKRTRFRNDVPDHAAFRFVPFAVETCGYMGNEAVKFVNRLEDIAAERGRIPKGAFVRWAMQLLSVGQRGNAEMYRRSGLAGCMGFLWVTGFSFFHCVASPFHSFVTTAGVGWSSRGSKVCVTMLALQCQC